jgi:hypothetical protein
VLLDGALKNIRLSARRHLDEASQRSRASTEREDEHEHEHEATVTEDHAR